MSYPEILKDIGKVKTLSTDNKEIVGAINEHEQQINENKTGINDLDNKINKLSLIEMPHNQSLNQNLEFGLYHFFDVIDGFPNEYTPRDNDFVLEIIPSGVDNYLWQTQVLTDIRSGRQYRRAITGGNRSSWDELITKDATNNKWLDLDTHVDNCWDFGTFRCRNWLGLPYRENEDGQGTIVNTVYNGVAEYGWLRQEYISPHSGARFSRTRIHTTWTPWIKEVTSVCSSMDTANGYLYAWSDSYTDTLLIEEVGDLVHVGGLIRINNSVNDVKINAVPLPKVGRDGWFLCNCLDSPNNFRMYLGWDGFLYTKTQDFSGIFQVDFTYRKG